MEETVKAEQREAKVTVTYLGFIREMTGTKDEIFVIQDGEHVRDVLARAAETHPRMAKIRDQLRVSINGVMTQENLVLKDEDHLILMAPIVGG